jgi:hypothetical protein
MANVQKPNYLFFDQYTTQATTGGGPYLPYFTGPFVIESVIMTVGATTGTFGIAIDGVDSAVQFIVATATRSVQLDLPGWKVDGIGISANTTSTSGMIAGSSLQVLLRNYPD